MLVLNTEGQTYLNSDFLSSPTAGIPAVLITADNVVFRNLSGGEVRSIQDEGIQITSNNVTVENLVGGILSRQFSEPVIDATDTAGDIIFRNFGSRAGRVLLGEGDDVVLDAGQVTVELNVGGIVEDSATALLLAGGDDNITIDYDSFSILFTDNPADIATTRLGYFAGGGNDDIEIKDLDGTLDYLSLFAFETLNLTYGAAADGVTASEVSILDGTRSTFEASLTVIVNQSVSANLTNLTVADVRVDRGLLVMDAATTGAIMGGAGNDRVTLGADAVVTNDISLGDGDDSFIESGTALVGGTVFGEGGNDSLIGSAADDRLNGGAGNDTIAGGGGADTLTGGAGIDTFTGSLTDLAGDTITDFEAIDILRITAAFTVEETTGAETLTLTTADNSMFVLNLNGDYANSGFLATGQSTGSTIISQIGDLIALAEGTALGAANINGIALDSFLSSDTSDSFVVKLRPADSVAGFDNSLGVYEVRGDGSIADVQILTGNVKDGGTFEVENLDDGSSLGFFIVQDGNNVFTAAQIASGNFSIAIDSGSAILSVDGTPLTAATIFLSHDAALNGDSQEHVVSGAADDGSGELRIGFEDLKRDGTVSDDDFQDVVFQVEALLPDVAVVI